MPPTVPLVDRIKSVLASEGISIQVLAGGESDSVAVTLIARDWELVDPSADSSAPAGSSSPPGATPTVPEPGFWFEHTVPAALPRRLLHLSERLVGGCSLSGKERLELAYSRGRQASAIARGEIGAFTGDRCPLKNRCYIALHWDQPDRSFFTWQYSTYIAAVGTADGGFDFSTVSHGFASRSEALAFALGAGFRELPETR